MATGTRSVFFGCDRAESQKLQRQTVNLCLEVRGCVYVGDVV